MNRTRRVAITPVQTDNIKLDVHVLHGSVLVVIVQNQEMEFAGATEGNFNQT